MLILLSIFTAYPFACADKLNRIQADSEVHVQQGKVAKIALARATADRRPQTAKLSPFQFGLYQRKPTDNSSVLEVNAFA